MLDLVKPLGYSLSVNFLFLGIIFISSKAPSPATLFLCIIFGFANDIFTNNTLAFNMLESLAVYLFVNYFSKYTNIASQNKYTLVTKTVVILLLIFADIVFNSIKARIFLPLFSLTVFAQSFFIYALVGYFANKWIKQDPKCNINHHLYY